jgi:tetratricopeptide (TPR) repeat protein
VAIRLRKTTSSALACLVCLTLVVPALREARAADAPSAEGQADARRLAAKDKFDQGVTAYKEERYQDAVRLFKDADAIAPSAALSFNVARALEKLDDTSGALRWYRDFLRRSPQAPNGPDVQSKVTTLAAALAQKGVQQISVLSEPAGAVVLLDGQNIGVTPITRDIPPGKHRLVLRLDGYQESTKDVVLEPRTPQDVTLQLAERTETAAKAPGASPATSSSNGQPGAVESDRGPRFGVAPYVLMGAGTAGLLGALGFELARRSADSDAEAASQNEFQGHYDTMEGRQTTARVLAGVGGALLVTGGVLFVLDYQRKEQPKVALGCDASGCALVAKGSFQ